MHAAHNVKYTCTHHDSRLLFSFQKRKKKKKIEIETDAILHSISTELSKTECDPNRLMQVLMTRLCTHETVLESNT